jgi:cell division septation protein DedD
MQIDIGELIADLLYENQTVTVPGLGAFVKSSDPADLDKYLGAARPAGTSLAFNENLAIDDGLLVGGLREKYKLSYQEAKKLIDDYVRQIRQTLARKEVVLLPRVGRLYNDFQQKLQFVSDGHNFDLESFGLPELKVQPVAAVRDLAGANPPTETVALAGQKKSWLRKNGILLASLVVFLAVLTTFFILYPDYFRKSRESDPTAGIPESRLNVKPSEAEEPAQTSPPTGTNEEDGAQQDESSLSEASTLPPDSKTCIIAIGVFGEKENVDRLARRIIDAGYEPFLEDKGSRTRVGIQFAYEDEAEVQEKLRQIREEFERSAFVLRR